MLELYVYCLIRYGIWIKKGIIWRWEKILIKSRDYRKTSEYIIVSLVTDLHLVIGIGHCISKEHAHFMAEQFKASGIPSISLVGDSKYGERNTAKRDSWMVRYPARANRVDGVTVKRTCVKEHKEYGKGNRMGYAFISYSSKNTEDAKALNSALMNTWNLLIKSKS